MRRNILSAVIPLIFFFNYSTSQTLEEFSKRFSIEGGVAMHLIGEDVGVLEGIKEVGFPSHTKSNFAKPAFYYGFTFRINNQISIGYKNTMINSSGFEGSKIVPQECRKICFFGLCLPEMCRNKLKFNVSSAAIKINEFETAWTNAQNSVGLKVGLALYQHDRIGYYYNTSLFSLDPDVETNFRGNLFSDKGAALSIGGFWNFLNFSKRLKMGVELNYYSIPKATLESLETEFGTFPAMTIRRDQLNVEVGMKYFIF